MKENITHCCAILVLCLLVSSAIAETWTVTNAVELKAALNVAETNLQSDTIILVAGVYEVDDLAGQLLTYEPNGTDPGAENYTLTLQSTNGLAIVDGNASKQGMRLTAMGSDMRDAAITVKGLRFRECRIFDPIFTGAGLFVRTQWGDILIEDCEFQYCIASDIYKDPSGGGCYARSGGTGTTIIRNCRFLDNRANISGGGLYMVGNPTARVENCTFMRNDGYQGGGLYLSGVGCSTTIENCTFYDNSGRAPETGAGLYVRLWFDADDVTLRNVISWTNTATGIGQDMFFADDGNGNGTGAVVVIEYSNYADLKAEVGDNITSNFNIYTDPMLADTNDSNCALLEQSPCIDAGTNVAQIVDDVDHIPRPLDGDTNGIPLYDIGASEFAHPFADTDSDGMYDKWEADGLLDPTDPNGIHGPGGDPDADGGTNWFEFVADTDPNDGASLLQITNIADVAGDIQISWVGGQVVTQIIESATNLALGGWTAIYTNLPPTALTPVVLDTNAPAASAFYRIRALR